LLPTMTLAGTRSSFPSSTGTPGSPSVGRGSSAQSPRSTWSPSRLGSGSSGGRSAYALLTSHVPAQTAGSPSSQALSPSRTGQNLKLNATVNSESRTVTFGPSTVTPSVGATCTTARSVRHHASNSVHSADSLLRSFKLFLVPGESPPFALLCSHHISE
jgi:hypothetical protein